MLIQTIKQAGAVGVASNSKATAQVPTSGTHKGLYLRFLTAAGAEVALVDIKSEISKISALINGEVIINATPTFLLDLQKYYGDAFGNGNVAGIVPIVFERRNLPLRESRDITSLGMADVDSFTIEIECGALVNVSSIEVHSAISGEQRRLGQHIRILEHAQSFATTGLQEIATLPKFANDVAYLGMHIEAGLGTFEKVSVKISGNAIFEDISPNLNQVLLASGQRTVQSGYFHVDFAKENDFLAMLPMAGIKDFRQFITWKTAAPGTFNIYSETLWGLNVKK